MKELSVTTYDSNLYADENLLYRNKLIDPVQLDINMTYMYGKDSDIFPLLTKTRGEGLMKSKTPIRANDTTFTWKVFGRMKHVSECAGVSGSGNVGKGHALFTIKMRDGMFIKQYGAMSPSGGYRIRIEKEMGKQSDGFHYYLVQSKDTTGAGIPVTEFAVGKYWVLTAPTVPLSKAGGNRDNTMTPGEWVSQFGLHRWSKHIAGNVSNKTLNIRLPLDNGGTTDMWMPFDMKRFDIDRMLLEEDHLWHSEFNRDEKGNITLIDEETHEPVPETAGVKEIVTSIGNYDTYSDLTLAKIDSTIVSAFGNRVDNTPTEIIIYTGDGGIRQFNKALQDDANTNTYMIPLGDRVIGESDGYLTYGKYFNQYKTIDGKIISIINTNLFNHGPQAEKDRANGNMIAGFPAYSYNMVSLDHSRTDDGGRNIGLIAEKGREYITGVYKGMSPLPPVWGSVPESLLSTRQDIATYEIMSSMGIYMTNPTTSFWLERT